MKYRDMVIEASEPSIERDAEKRRWRRFKIRVLSSPAGEMPPEKALSVRCDATALQTQLRALEGRELDRDGLISLGQLLGLLLLPPGMNGEAGGVRDLLVRSLDLVGQDSGLRVRMRLPAELASIPWEYVYLSRSGTSDAMDGFLALDPRVALVRHEALPVGQPQVGAPPGEISVLAAMVSPSGFQFLDLDREESDLRQALQQQAGLRLSVLKNATLQQVEGAVAGTCIFHFAGHGEFCLRAGDTPGTVTGDGAIVLDDGKIDAEQLAMNLRGNGVRLVVLGGCDTGRRDGTYVWGGFAPALVRHEIPAVVANQYSIKDSCAIAFSRQFYRSLVGGLPIERAVSAGRIAAYNADQSGRDWGVPVLYLRAGDGQLFEGATDAEVRRAGRAGVEVDVRVRADEVAAGGFVLGAKVREMSQGTVHADVEIAGTVYGTVVGVDLDSLGGGTVKVDSKAKIVGPGGSLTGAKIGEIG
jgi:hypothetical protein